MHYCLDFTYAREKQREHCIVWPVTKNQNKQKLKNKQPDKKQEHKQQKLSVVRKTNRLQCSFCSLAPPEIIIVFRLKFYSNLRHNFYWSSRSTREKEKGKKKKVSKSEFLYHLSNVYALYRSQMGPSLFSLNTYFLFLY